MHLLDRYALSCGLKIKKPFIFEKYFPLTLTNYITLHTTSKEAKSYDHWQEVVDLLHPVCNKNNISIVQIGAAGERPIQKCVHLLGQTNINQVAYILKSALCHLGVDSFPAHIASSYDIPIVSLYSNNHINCVKPYFGDSKKHFLLEPDRKGEKPSFALQEQPKSINSIPPEKIADSVFKALSLSDRCNIRSLYFGSLYEHLMVEVVPRGFYYNQQVGVDAFIVRMDMEFNEPVLIEQLKVCPCNIVTDKPINLEIVKAFRKRINQIIYLVRENHKPEFIKDLSNLGVRFEVLSELPSEEFEPLKIHYMDYSSINYRPCKIPDELKSVEPSKVWYKTRKFILSENAIYPSKAAWDNKITIPNFQETASPIAQIKKRADLWVESDHFYFFEKLD